MGRKKRLRKRIKGLEKQVRIHEDKQDKEAQKERPNVDLLKYWESETEEYAKQIEEAEGMLNRKKKKKRTPPDEDILVIRW